MASGGVRNLLQESSGPKGFDLGLEPIDGGGIPGIVGHRVGDVSIAYEMAEPAKAEGRSGTFRNLVCFWVLSGSRRGFSPKDCAEAVLIQG